MDDGTYAGWVHVMDYVIPVLTMIAIVVVVVWIARSLLRRGERRRAALARYRIRNGRRPRQR